MGRLWVNLFESSRALDERASETSDDADIPSDLRVYRLRRSGRGKMIKAADESACKPGTVRIWRGRPLTCGFTSFKIARAVVGPSRC
jgi:hypothetical protein